MRVLLIIKLTLYALFISSCACAMEVERPAKRERDRCVVVYCQSNEKIIINSTILPLIPGLQRVVRVPHSVKIIGNVVGCACQVKKTLRTRNQMLRKREEQPLSQVNGNQYILQQINDLVKERLSTISDDELADTINTAYDLRAVHIVNACAKLWLSKLQWPIKIEALRYSANYNKIYTDITNSYLKKHYEIKTLQAGDELNIFDLIALGNISIQNNYAYLTEKGLTSLSGTADLIDRTDITGLILTNNKLTCFRGLPKFGPLTFLYAAYNKITKIASEEFGNNIETIGLGFNQIASIERGAFKNLKKLKTLWLDHNCLTYIDPQVFTGLTSLRLLDLSANQLDKNNISAIRNLLPYTKIMDGEI